mgnify:CR=1 FL=1
MVTTFLGVIILAYLIAKYQKMRGLDFYPSFAKSILALTAIAGIIWKMLV